MKIASHLTLGSLVLTLTIAQTNNPLNDFIGGVRTGAAAINSAASLQAAQATAAAASAASAASITAAPTDPVQSARSAFSSNFGALSSEAASVSSAAGAAATSAASAVGVTNNSGLSKGAIAGIVIGSLVGFGLLIGLLVALCCCLVIPRRRRKREDVHSEKNSTAVAGSRSSRFWGSKKRARSPGSAYNTVPLNPTSTAHRSSTHSHHGGNGGFFNRRGSQVPSLSQHPAMRSEHNDPLINDATGHHNNHTGLKAGATGLAVGAAAGSVAGRKHNDHYDHNGHHNTAAPLTSHTVKNNHSNGSHSLPSSTGVLPPNHHGTDPFPGTTGLATGTTTGPLAGHNHHAHGGHGNYPSSGHDLNNRNGTSALASPGHGTHNTSDAHAHRGFGSGATGLAAGTAAGVLASRHHGDHHDQRGHSTSPLVHNSSDRQSNVSAANPLDASINSNHPRHGVTHANQGAGTGMTGLVAGAAAGGLTGRRHNDHDHEHSHQVLGSHHGTSHHHSRGSLNNPPSNVSTHHESDHPHNARNGGAASLATGAAAGALLGRHHTDHNDHSHHHNSLTHHNTATSRHPSDLPSGHPHSNPTSYGNHHDTGRSHHAIGAGATGLAAGTTAGALANRSHNDHTNYHDDVLSHSHRNSTAHQLGDASTTSSNAGIVPHAQNSHTALHSHHDNGPGASGLAIGATGGALAASHNNTRNERSDYHASPLGQGTNLSSTPSNFGNSSSDHRTGHENTHMHRGAGTGIAGLAAGTTAGLLAGRHHNDHKERSEHYSSPVNHISTNRHFSGLPSGESGTNSDSHHNHSHNNTVSHEHHGTGVGTSNLVSGAVAHGLDDRTHGTHQDRRSQTHLPANSYVSSHSGSSHSPVRNTGPSAATVTSGHHELGAGAYRTDIMHSGTSQNKGQLERNSHPDGLAVNDNVYEADHRGQLVPSTSHLGAHVPHDNQSTTSAIPNYGSHQSPITQRQTNSYDELEANATGQTGIPGHQSILSRGLHPQREDQDQSTVSTHTVGAPKVPFATSQTSSSSRPYGQTSEANKEAHRNFVPSAAALAAGTALGSSLSGDNNRHANTAGHVASNENPDRYAGVGSLAASSNQNVHHNSIIQNKLESDSSQMHVKGPSPETSTSNQYTPSPNQVYQGPQHSTTSTKISHSNPKNLSSTFSSSTTRRPVASNIVEPNNSKQSMMKTATKGTGLASSSSEKLSDHSKNDTLRQATDNTHAVGSFGEYSQSGEGRSDPSNTSLKTGTSRGGLASLLHRNKTPAPHNSSSMSQDREVLTSPDQTSRLTEAEPGRPIAQDSRSQSKVRSAIPGAGLAGIFHNKQSKKDSKSTYTDPSLRLKEPSVRTDDDPTTAGSTIPHNSHDNTTQASTSKPATRSNRVSGLFHTKPKPTHKDLTTSSSYQVPATQLAPTDHESKPSHTGIKLGAAGAGAGLAGAGLAQHIHHSNQDQRDHNNMPSSTGQNSRHSSEAGSYDPIRGVSDSRTNLDTSYANSGAQNRSQQYHESETGQDRGSRLNDIDSRSPTANVTVDQSQPMIPGSSVLAHDLLPRMPYNGSSQRQSAEPSHENNATSYLSKFSGHQSPRDLYTDITNQDGPASAHVVEQARFHGLPPTVAASVGPATSQSRPDTSLDPQTMASKSENRTGLDSLPSAAHRHSFSNKSTRSGTFGDDATVSTQSIYEDAISNKSRRQSAASLSRSRSRSHSRPRSKYLPPTSKPTQVPAVSNAPQVVGNPYQSKYIDSHHIEAPSAAQRQSLHNHEEPRRRSDPYYDDADAQHPRYHANRSSQALPSATPKMLHLTAGRAENSSDVSSLSNYETSSNSGAEQYQRGSDPYQPAQFNPSPKSLRRVSDVTISSKAGDHTQHNGSGSPTTLQPPPIPQQYSGQHSAVHQRNFSGPTGMDRRSIDGSTPRAESDVLAQRKSQTSLKSANGQGRRLRFEDEEMATNNPFVPHQSDLVDSGYQSRGRSHGVGEAL